MKQDKTVLIIDAGNTSLKIGIFQNGREHEVLRADFQDEKTLIAIHEKYNRPEVFIASVLSETDTKKLEHFFPNALFFNRNSLLPINILYTSETLGLDRICNAVAAQHLSNGKKAVAIDLGTCIKFDFIDEHSNYLGGSIAPGIRLRFQSMNDYTGNLPMVHNWKKSALVGTSTENSLRSGVMNGIQAELEQFIIRYEIEYGPLTFFVTGGDLHYFDFPVKNNIFVNENLTLIGLYLIYELNVN